MKRFSKAGLIIFLFGLLGRLSLPTAHFLGRVLGSLTILLPSRAKSVTATNLALCFPELDADQRRKLLRSSLRHTGLTTLEIPLMWEWPVQRCLDLIQEVEGEAVLERARQSGKGILILAPHLGNWELVGLYFSAHHKMASLYSPPQIQALEDYMVQVRGRVGSELVRGDRHGLVRLISLLREGQMSGILPDQSPRGKGMAYAPFFGIDVRTMTLVSKLLQKSGAYPILAYAERLKGSRGFRLVMQDCEAALADPDPLVATTALNLAVENAVRQIPEQYQWEYKRFRHRRPGEVNPYYPDRLCR